MKNLKTGVFTLFMLMLFNISIQAQNYALRFNGNNNLVQSSKGFALQENSPTTLELWVKLDTVVWTTFIRLGMNLQTVGMNEYGELFTISNNTGPWHYNNTGFFLETGKWYHIAAVFCNAYSTVYVNGTQQGSRRYSPNENNSQSNKIFLGYCLDGIHRYKGIIDEVRVWSMARTEDEIRQNMCDTITGNEPNLRCYYRMTDGTGAILTDNSYNHDTATLINMGDSSWIKDFQIPDGSGISSDPFQLEAINHLFWFSNHHEHWGDGKHIVQSSDIDATYCTYWNDGLGFAPIGIDYDSKFQGNYDGQGHVIQNLRIERINQDYLGFFGFISGATIQNLGMTDLYSFGRGDIGGLVGFSSNSVIKNCFVKGVVFARDKFAGGLIGRITNSSVNYCHAEGNIEIMVSVAGGLIGGSSFDNNDQQLLFERRGYSTSGWWYYCWWIYWLSVRIHRHQQLFFLCTSQGNKLPGWICRNNLRGSKPQQLLCNRFRSGKRGRWVCIPNVWRCIHCNVLCCRQSYRVGRRRWILLFKDRQCCCQYKFLGQRYNRGFLQCRR